MKILDPFSTLLKSSYMMIFSLLILSNSLGSYAQTCCTYAGWTYQKLIAVDNASNSDTLIDYQILLIMDTQNPISIGNMKSDGSDIRIMDQNCNNLSYWIESGINTDTTKIWVKLLVLPANSSINITMFYGNPAAVSESNGDLTFIFFDGFDSNMVDSGKWSIQGNPSITFNSGFISITSNTSNFVEGLYTTKVLDNVILEAEIKGSFQSGLSSGGGQVFGFSDYPNYGNIGWLGWRNYFFYYPPDGDFMHRLYQDPTSPNQLNFPFNGMSKWSRYRLTWTSSYADASVDGSKQAISQPYNPGYVVLYNYHMEETHCDYVFARSYADPEPIVSNIGQTSSGVLVTSLMVTDILCNGDSTGIIEVADSSVNPLIYAWTPNVSSDSIATGLSAGLYVVIVSDTSLGCSSVDSIIITEPPAINLALSVSDVTCKWGSDGTIDAAVSGGIGTYTYQWSDSSGVGASIDSLAEGIYSVTITDSNNCSVSDSAVVVEPPQIMTNESITHVTCPGFNNGAIILNPSDGIPPYTYIWLPNVSTDSSASGLSAGQYDISLIDSNGCSIQDTVFVLELSSGPATSSISGENNVIPFSSHGYGITNTSGSTYNWFTLGGTQTFGGNTDSIQVLWDSIGIGQVMVVETDSFGCVGDTMILFVNISSSAYIEENNLTNFGIYPNPGKGIITVEFAVSEPKDIVINLVTINGKILETFIKTKVMGKFKETMDLQTYAKGIYQVHISMDGDIINRKIIIQ